MVRETAVVPVDLQQMVGPAINVEVVERVPGPDDVAPGREFHEPVADHRLGLARRMGVGLAGEVVLDRPCVGGHRQKIAVRHLVRLVVQACRLDRDCALDGSEGPAGRVEHADHPSRNVHLDRAKVDMVEEEVAVRQLGHAGDAGVRHVIPDHLALFVDGHQHPPAGGEADLGRRHEGLADIDRPPHAQQREPGLHLRGPRDLRRDGRPHRAVGWKRRGAVGERHRSGIAGGNGYAVFGVGAHADDGEPLFRIVGRAVNDRAGSPSVVDGEPDGNRFVGCETDQGDQRHALVGVFLDGRRRHESGHARLSPAGRAPGVTGSASPATNRADRTRTARGRPNRGTSAV